MKVASASLAAKRRKRAKRVLAYVALIGLSTAFVAPFLWLVLTSLKPNEQIFFDPAKGFFAQLLPRWETPQAILKARASGNPLPPGAALAAWARLVFQHYLDGLSFIPFGAQLRNTAAICTLVTAGTLLSSAFVAYGFAHVRWPGRDVVFYAMLATMMLPYQVTMIPVFMIFKTLGWVNTVLPLVVPAWLGSVFSVFLLRQFYLTIPSDLVDAARIDGCSEIGIWSRLVVPLSKPALATVALFSFLGSWNDFLGPLIYLQDEVKYTLSLGLAMFRGQYGSFYGELMAVSTVITVPIVVLFFFTQRTFIQGIKLTGLKG